MVKRVAVAVLLLGLAAVFVAALAWAKAPLDRQLILLDQPILLEPGAASGGAFEPEHEGPHALGIRISQPPPRETLGAWIGGGWATFDGPPGLVVLYSVRENGLVVQSGVAREFTKGYAEGQEEIVILALVANAPAKQLEAEVRIDHARAELAGLTASLVVMPHGDWIAYRRLEAGVRLALVFAVPGFFIVGGGALVLLLLWRKRRRGSPPAARSVPPVRQGA